MITEDCHFQTSKARLKLAWTLYLACSRLKPQVSRLHVGTEAAIQLPETFSSWEQSGPTRSAHSWKSSFTVAWNGWILQPSEWEVQRLSTVIGLARRRSVLADMQARSVGRKGAWKAGQTFKDTDEWIRKGRRNSKMQETNLTGKKSVCLFVTMQFSVLMTIFKLKDTLVKTSLWKNWPVTGKVTKQVLWTSQTHKNERQKESFAWAAASYAFVCQEGFPERLHTRRSLRWGSRRFFDKNQRRNVLSKKFRFADRGNDRASEKAIEYRYVAPYTQCVTASGLPPASVVYFI